MNERAQAATHPYPFERTGELLESHGLEPAGARRTAEAHRDFAARGPQGLAGAAAGGGAAAVEWRHAL
jgi:hypothetical protein